MAAGNNPGDPRGPLTPAGVDRDRLPGWGSLPLMADTPQARPGAPARGIRVAGLGSLAGLNRALVPAPAPLGRATALVRHPRLATTPGAPTPQPAGQLVLRTSPAVSRIQGRPLLAN